MPSEIYVRVPADFWDFSKTGPGTPLLKLLSWRTEGRVLRDLFLQIVIRAKLDFSDGRIADYDIGWLACPTSPRIVKRYISRLVEAGLIVPLGDGNYYVPAAEEWPPLERVGTRDPIPDLTRRRVYERDGYRCTKCGKADRLSLDHVIPWSRGGSDTESNLSTRCVPCNSEKGARV